MHFRAVRGVGQRDDKNRMAVVVLSDLDHVSAVFKNAFNLNDTNCSVNSSLPKELADFKSDLLFKRKALKTKKNMSTRVVERRGLPQLEKLIPKARPQDPQTYEILEKFEIQLDTYTRKYIPGQGSIDDVDIDIYT